MGRKKDPPDPLGTVAEFLLGCSLAVRRDLPVYVGIDPGAHGAIAFVCGKGHAVIDIPTYQAERDGGKTTLFDIPAITELFRMFRVEMKNRQVNCCVEKTLPNMAGGGKDGGSKSPYNAYKVGCAYYMWPLFLYSWFGNCREFHPASWKRKTGLWGKTKKYSLEKARKDFPDADLRLMEHHDRAEALILAAYLRGVLKREGVERGMR